MSFASWGEDKGILLCYTSKAVAINAGMVFRTAEGTAYGLDQLKDPLKRPVSLSRGSEKVQQIRFLRILQSFWENSVSACIKKKKKRFN